MNQHTQDEDEENEEEKSYLGHGDHWEAVGISSGEDFAQLIPLALQEGKLTGKATPPWPNPPCSEVILLEMPQGPLVIVSLCGAFPEPGDIRFMSAFPLLPETTQWVVQIDNLSNSYGSIEGLIEGNLANGHNLCWFVPRFALEVEHWKKAEFAHVAFSALALHLEPFKAEPIVIEGEQAERLRRMMNVSDANNEDDSSTPQLTFETHSLRSFFPTSHDHHEFVGKALNVRGIDPAFNLPGWIIDLECIHAEDEEKDDFTIPLYVFPSAIAQNDYIPKTGDLIHGSAWLQGSWIAPASQDDLTR